MKDEQVEEALGYKLKDRRIGGKESMKEYNDDELMDIKEQKWTLE